MSIRHAEIFGTTGNPCPSWCTLPAGHGYDASDHEGEYRTHELAVVNGPGVFVEIWAGERLLLNDDGAVVFIDRPAIQVDANAQLTATQARAAAAALARAADLLDGIR